MPKFVKEADVEIVETVKENAISKAEYDRRVKLGVDSPEYINSSLSHFVV